MCCQRKYNSSNSEIKVTCERSLNRFQWERFSYFCLLFFNCHLPVGLSTIWASSVLENIVSLLNKNSCISFSFLFKLPDGMNQSVVSYHKIYYLSTHMKASFINAQSYCSSLGLELASFETREESDWFSDIFVASRQVIDPGWCFIGGMRIFNDAALSKANWYWLNSGQKINYDLTWDPQQPDNNNGIQWCLGLSKINSNSTIYADIECYNREESFICQKKELIQPCTGN
jgi:hypothetical protein